MINLIPAGALIMQVKPHRENEGEYFLGHEMIYKGFNQIVHAYPASGFIKGVCADNVENYIENTDSLFSALVFQHKNVQVHEALEKLATSESWANTPFEYDKMRRPDAVENDHHKKLIELVRGFRNAERINAITVISKNKGISCISFIAYVVKTAVINVLFKEGYSGALKMQLGVIDYLRLNEHGKKLDKVPLNELEKFETLMLKELEKNKIGIGEEKFDDLLRELYRPVKCYGKKHLGDLYKDKKNWEMSVMVYNSCLSASHISVENANKLNSTSIKVDEMALKKTLEVSSVVETTGKKLSF